eukprot:tig00000851_g4911.t1
MYMHSRHAQSMDQTIEEIARDYSASWMTAVEVAPRPPGRGPPVRPARRRRAVPGLTAGRAVLDDDVFIGAENSFNLFTVRRNAEAPTVGRTRSAPASRSSASSTSASSSTASATVRPAPPPAPRPTAALFPLPAGRARPHVYMFDFKSPSLFEAAGPLSAD